MSKKYYTVYKIENKINGKFYIGAHATSNLDDGYMGSGKLIKRAIAKYGVENFEKSYLAVFDDPADMFALESELVCESVVIDPLCYNLKDGGLGGFDHVNSSTDHQRHAAAASNLRQQTLRNDPQWRNAKSTKMSETMRRIWASGARKLDDGFPQAFAGRTHSDEAKRRIGAANAQMTGEKNSQFGTAWVYNEALKESRKVSRDALADHLNQGWKRGRKMKF